MCYGVPGPHGHLVLTVKNKTQGLEPALLQLTLVAGISPQHGLKR
jgi:hypothetical protein